MYVDIEYDSDELKATHTRFKKLAELPLLDWN